MNTSTTVNKAQLARSLAKKMEELMKKRTRCEVWTRVMGYHRPVSQFNKGKKSEHAERIHFSEKMTMESKIGARI